MKGKSPYQPEIDGLRAIAVLSVIFFHAGLGFSGGYVGVDIFFVISGYLITGIISRSLNNDRFSLLEFWERRIRRILPALSVTILFTLLAGYFLLLPNDLLDLGKATLAQAALLANVYFWHSTGYFDGPAELKPLLHTWSLAVEEQFYVVFPLLLVAIRHRSPRFRVTLLGVLAAISLFLSIFGTSLFPTATFFLLPARAWELLAGSLLAIAPLPGCGSRFRNEVMALGGMAAIGLSIFLFNRETPFPGYAALLPVAGTSLLIHSFRGRKTIVARFLSLKAVVFIGLISYSLYLIHWPIFAYGRYIMGTVSPRQAAIMIGMTLVLAVLSWRFVERPFREKRLAAKRAAIFAFAASTTAAFASFAIFVFKSGGIPSRFPPNLSVQIDDVSWKGSEYMTQPLGEIHPEKLPRLGVTNSSSKTPDFLLWGDSHGSVMALIFDRVAAERGASGVAFNSAGYPPVPGIWLAEKDPDGSESKSRSDRLMEFLKHTGTPNLVLVGRWSAYCVGFSESELRNEPHRRNWNPRVTDQINAPNNQEESTRAFQRSIYALATECETAGIKLWILKEVPETGETECARRFVLSKLNPALFPLPDHTLSMGEYRNRQQAPGQAFNTLNPSSARVIDPSPFFFDRAGRTTNCRDGRALYRDNDHLTKAGIGLLRPLIEQLFDEMLGKTSAKNPLTTEIEHVNHR